MCDDPRREPRRPGRPRSREPRLTSATTTGPTPAVDLSASTSSRSEDLSARYALATILVVATLVRVWEATRTPLWLDEIFTLWTVRLGPHGTLDLLRRDMHPPLFFLAVWGWRALGGESALWLRLLPMVFGVATVAVVYAIGRDMFGRPAGLLAALIVTLHRSMVFHSQELRSFGMLWCLQAVAVWTAWRWVRSGRGRDAAGYVAAGAAALYTHYLAGFVLAVVAVCALVPLARMPRRLAGWVGLHVAIALLFAPQVPTLMAQTSLNKVEHWIQPPDAGDLVELARQLALGVRYLIPPLFVLALIPLFRRELRPAALLLWGVIAMPALAAWIATRQGAHLYTVRYMLYGVPFFAALVAGGVVSLPRRQIGVPVAVAIVVLAARALAMKAALPEADQLRRASQWLAPRLQPGDVVFHTETHSLLFFRHYRPDSAEHLLLLTQAHLPYYEGAELIPLDWRTGPEALDSVAAHGHRWWAIRVRHGGLDGKQAATLLDTRTGGPAMSWGLVTVWSGAPGTGGSSPR